MSQLVAMFCDIDDFCKAFEPIYEQRLIASGRKHRRRKSALSLSEIMTIRLWDKLMLRKRSLIETVNVQLKNISQIEHTRHRSITGFMVNVVAGLIAYTFHPKKPSL